MDLKKIYKHCGWHEKEILNSKLCGCFDCLKLFKPEEITSWIEESKDTLRGPGKTAVCPYCGVDAVLPESEDYELNRELLERMHGEYCEFVEDD